MTAARPGPDDASRDTAGGEHHPLMTVVEVAAALRVSKATVYRLVQSGVIPSMHTGRTVRISRRVVENLLRDDSTSPSPEA